MKLKKPSLSFQNQLTIMMTIVLTVTIIMVLLLIYLNIIKDLEQSFINDAVVEAKLIGEKAKTSALSKDHRVATQQLHQFNGSSTVQVAAILLPNQSLLGYFSVQHGLPLPRVNINQPLKLTEETLSIVEPIRDGGEIGGYIYVEHRLNELLGKKNSYLEVILVIFVSMLFFSILIANFSQKILTQPISRMVRHINDIYRSGNFKKRLKAVNNDNIGKLTIGFNQMLDAVQEREDELKTQSKQLQRLVEVRTEQLYQKAHFDSLTGLPNRYLLVDRLHQAISKSERNNSTIALLFLDLDRFKIINDNLGHQNGDLLLKEVAKRLSKLAREGDTVARLGGDEFVFLLENLATPKNAARTSQRIIDSFKTPFRIQDYILHVSTSIGISIYPDDGLDDKVLLRNADVSMYHAKEKGAGHFSFYTADMNESSLERLAIESNLRTAIKNNEFYLVYQPQLNLKENKYKNVEALLRWKNPHIGEISPGIFIPIAEETGIINQIDLWVISQTCKQIKKWDKQGFDDVTVAINISAGHLISDTLLQHLKRQILINQIKANQIEIEITEAVFVEHTERTIKTLQSIKKLGVKIAIDDFGTGYSSLQYIQNFPADTLKLDGMFINNLKSNLSGQGIVRSTIILAHSLGLELVTECVEDQFQLDFLREYNCDLVQGFLLSKPRRPEEIPSFFRQSEVFAVHSNSLNHQPKPIEV